MIVIIDHFLEKQSTARITAVSFVLLVVVALLDHLTGFELSFSIFYLLPIVLMTWYLQPQVGYLFSFVAALFWLLVDYSSNHTYSHVLIPIWNTIVRLSFFLVVTSLLAELKNRLSKEKTMATIDGLTGLLNAREFKLRAGSHIELAERHKHPLTLGYVDVDNFKQVNDQYGHSEGDRVLKAVAETLSECTRTTDVVGRLGGDEFAVFLPETDKSGARVMFQRIREALAQTASDGAWPIGFSIGVAVFSAVPGNIDEALKTADNLMYRVKKAGKNNLIYEEQP